MTRKLLITVLLLTLMISLISCAKQGDTKESSIFQMADVEYCKISSDKVEVKTGAGESFRTIAVLNKDDVINVLGQIGDWYVIQLDNNQVGCIDSVYSEPVIRENSQFQGPAIPQNRESENSGRQENNQTPTTSPVSDLTTREKQMVRLVNNERNKNDLSPLTVDLNLTRVARIKAQDMIDSNYFSHYSPNYGSPFDMLEDYGVKYLHAGENLAANTSVENAQEALMNSSGHRQNILNPNFTHIGVGIKQDKRDTYIFVQMFISKPR